MAAEGVLSNTAAKILEVLGSMTFQELRSAFGVKDEIRKLENTMRTIKAILLDAEEQHSKKNHQVIELLRKLKDAAYDADDLLDDFFSELKKRKVMTSSSKIAKEVRIFFSGSNQIAYNLKMSNKIKYMRQKLGEIKNDSQLIHLTGRFDEKGVDNTERETYSFVYAENVIGRDDDRNEIIQLLLASNDDKNVSVVPIVGIGGIGKTTLAQLVYNDEKIINNFELRMWVCVSKNFDLKIILEKIIKSTTNRVPKNLDIDQLEKKLREEIHMKAFLLVLDDMWNENSWKWSQLEDLLMNGARGSKILITTRSIKAVEATGSRLPFYSLRGLPEDKSWNLFTKMAFKQEIEPKDSRLVAIGKEIVAKCGGIPLILRTIGSSLLYKNKEIDWLNFSHGQLSKFLQQENGILPTLKLSYDYLPSHLKQCFAYCALFPKDYEIDKHNLIKLWMAQGFLQSSSNNNPCSEDVGDGYFMDLLGRSFFQDAKHDEWGNVTSCRMHDFMHDLAQLAAETECIMVTVNAADVHEGARHLSFDCNLDSSWKIPLGLPKADHIRTFLLPFQSFQDAEGKLNESDCQNLLSKFCGLRMLDLSNSGIEILPSSIDNLKHLRYLNLSYNDSIRKLPNSITSLVNLETINLSHCYCLVELPRDIRKMVSLRHLMIEKCISLIIMPKGVGLLTSLMTFPLFIVGWASNQLGLSELNGLNNLRGKLTIKNLGQIGSPKSHHFGILERKQYLQSLKLEWTPRVLADPPDDQDSLFEGLRPHPNLKQFTVFYFVGTRIPRWLSSLANLTSISLICFLECKYIPPLDQLFSLKSLKIDQFYALEYISVTNNNDPSCSTLSTTFFESLKELHISCCSNLKGWWRDGDGATTQMTELPSFPCLSKLDIRNCPKLTSMPLYPSLEELSLEETSLKPLQLTMMLNSHVTPSTSFTLSASLSKLKSLSVKNSQDLKSLPEECLQNLTSLVNLSIYSCPRLSQLSRGIEYLTSLRQMTIWECRSLANDDNDMQWQGLRSLHSLKIFILPKLVSLPVGLQYVTTLQHLSISTCHNLMALPEWIPKLTSLAELDISCCDKLTSLPEGMKLKCLKISDCPQLLERYRNNTVHIHWRKIAHIPDINIDGRWIQKEGRYQLNSEGCSSSY